MARRKQERERNRIFLKVSSVFLGAAFWYVWSGIYPIHKDIDVPLCFYNAPEGMKITACDGIRVQLRATRPVWQSLDNEQLAVHVDARRFNEGPNRVDVSEDALLLPEMVKLVHYSPGNVVAVMEPDKVSGGELAAVVCS